MQTPATSSGDIAVTTGTAVTARPAKLLCVTLTPAAAASSVVIYDNASAAAGTVIARLAAAASTSSVVWHCEYGAVANNGLFAVVTGAGAIANVGYVAE